MFDTSVATTTLELLHMYIHVITQKLFLHVHVELHTITRYNKNKFLAQTIFPECDFWKRSRHI